MATTVLMAENSKQSGRRKSKSNEATQNKKKQPQRGMGVAALELLRMQERWKKMTEISINPSPSLSLTNNFSLPASFTGPIPAQFGTCGAVNGVGLNQSFLVQKTGNGGLISGVGEVFSGQFQADPYEPGAPNPGLQVGNLGETSEELSSMPNMTCYYSDRCGLCHKKKKRVNGENIGCINRTRNKYNDHQSSLKDCGFPRFNQELEVLAVHKKGGRSGGGGVFMEYEFFPEKCDRDTSSKEVMELISSSEASVTTATTCCSTGLIDASTSIDLSLKLSY